MVVLETYIGYRLLKGKRKKGDIKKKYNSQEDKSLSGRFARTLYGISGGKK